MDAPTKRALEAQIAEAPDDRARYLVYADWLQQQDDPRGELIMLHPRPTMVEAFVANHRRALLGTLADHVHAPHYDVEIEWFMGFIKRAKISWTAITGHVALAALLDSPSAIFLQELVIESIGPLPTDPKRIVAQLVDRGSPATLALITIGKPGQWTPPPELVAAFPRLAGDPRTAWREVMAKVAAQRKLKIEIDATRLPALVPRTPDVSVDVDKILVGLKAELGKQRVLGVLAAMPLVFERDSLDAFALALAMEWQQIGEDPRWPFDALGPLGWERCVRWIGAHLANWSHQRAVQGIQHLVRIGSDAAIYEIITLAFAPRSYGARRLDAVSALDIVAKKRALRDRDALVVRIVPATSSERVLATQRAWLESAMLAGQRIPVDEFRRYVSGDPIRRTLASTLLWGDYAGEQLVRTFRVDDTGWPTHEPTGAIGLVHPAELAPDERRSIDEQAIRQLDRPVFFLTADEARRTRLTRYANREAGVFALLAKFEERGWSQEVDDALSTTWTKPFARDDVVAAAQLDDSGASIVTVEVRPRHGFGDPVAFESLHVATISELLWDLEFASGELPRVAPVERPRPIVVERAKSARSKCNVCGETIAKDSQRIGIERRIETPQYTGRATVWIHPACRAGAPELADIDVDALLGQ